MPNCNSQQRSSPDAHIHHKQAGMNREAWVALLRVRTLSECPEGNPRGLTLDRNPNPGIAREGGKQKEERERERERERENTFLCKALTKGNARPAHRIKD